MNENILTGGVVTLIGMLLGGVIIFLRRLFDHLESRLAAWRYLKDVDLLIVKENVKIAHLQYGLRAPFLSLPKDFDFPYPDKTV